MLQPGTMASKQDVAGGYELQHPAEKCPTVWLRKVDKAERAVCSTGTAWGILKTPNSMIAFWAFRHVLYGGLAITAMLLDTSGIAQIAVGIVFGVAHAWKLLAFLIRSTIYDGYDEKHKPPQEAKAQQGTPHEEPISV